MKRIADASHRILPLMSFRRTHTALFASVAVACAVVAAVSAQTSQPGEIDRSTMGIDTSVNHPIEPRVADRGALTGESRIMPYELAMPIGFNRVYAVPGRPGLFYRASGGLYVVFEEGEYRQNKEGTVIAVTPAGATYYVGKPDWATILRPSDFIAGSVQSHQADRESKKSARTAVVAERNDEVAAESAAVDAECDATQLAPIDCEVPAVGPERVGYGKAHSQSQRHVEATEEALPVSFASAAPDTAAWAGTLPLGVDRSFLVGDGAAVRPRMIADFFYRQERLSSLIERAGSSAQR